MIIKIDEPKEFICEKDHYLINGKKYYRVTQIKGVIKNQGLINWQMSVGKKKSYDIMVNRANFGSKNHKLIELQLSGNKIDLSNYDEDTQDVQTKFNDFREKHDLKPELLEQHLYSKYGYAGTADYIGYVDGKLTILDWKTSKDIYAEYWLQLSAYVVAFEEMSGLKIEQVGILILRENQKPKYETKTRDEMLKEFKVFQACLTIFRWQRNEKI